MKTYCLRDESLHRVLQFEKDDKGILFLTEVEVIKDYDDETEQFCEKETYQCSEFIHGDLDTSLISMIEYGMKNKPIKLQLSRWYPHVDPEDFLPYGNVYITPIFEYFEKEDFMRVTLKFCKVRKMLKDKQYVYTLIDKEEIEEFYNFLRN